MTKFLIPACALLLCASTAGADVISDWNLQTGMRVGAASPARRGPSAVLDFAMVHLAMHDAVQAIERRYQPYCTRIRGAKGSPVAAAAAAARDVLLGLFPLQGDAILAEYDRLTRGYIEQRLMAPIDRGTEAGMAAAACILKRLPGDDEERNTADSFVGGTGIGEWRPAGTLPMAADFLARVAPFGMKDQDQFRMRIPPPDLTSGAYTRDYNEVKAKGASEATGHTRTPAETAIAVFFSDAPANYWNRRLRELVLERRLNLGDSARMFALVTMATADSLIASWDTKIHYNFWRPVTAIRNGELDGNPDTVGNPAWNSFFAAPNYPDYTSGANNVSGATTTILALLFGDRQRSTFVLHSNAAGAVPREYTRFSDIASDVVDARVFMGIHFRFADTTGRLQGSLVALWTFTQFLRPVGWRD